MEKKESSDKTILTGLLIALAFFATGSGYLTWVYHLRGFYSAGQVDFMAQVIGYLLQAAGLFTVYQGNAFGRGDTSPETRHIHRHSLLLFICGWFIFLCLSGSASSGAVTLIFGCGMNFMIGLIGAHYLLALARYTSPKRKAITFGAGYAAGSVLSFLLSLPADGTFLTQPYIFIIYAVLAAAIVFVYDRITRESDICSRDQELSDNKRNDNSRFLAIAALTVIMLSLVSSAGAFFPIASTESSSISLEFSRAFYAVGLIAAGLINDRRRSVGAVLCIAALCFPFFSVTAAGSLGIAALMRILGYVFLGFYTVYRVILFVDLSVRSERVKLACFGLMFGRIGDAAGALLGIHLSGRSMILVAVIAAAFVASIFLFFYLYRTLYMQPAATVGDRIGSFAELYGLSSRETQILELVLERCSNKDIAARLFISENTVKFHMRNLLKKTGCANRAGLISLFNGFSVSR